MHHLTKQQFELRLKEFFERHDPAKEELAHVIASKFHLHQEQVFEHLTEIYDKHVEHEPHGFREKFMAIIYP